jgi:hypothetical protein
VVLRAERSADTNDVMSNDVDMTDTATLMSVVVITTYIVSVSDAPIGAAVSVEDGMLHRTFREESGSASTTVPMPLVSLLYQQLPALQ